MSPLYLFYLLNAFHLRSNVHLSEKYTHDISMPTQVRDQKFEPCISCSLHISFTPERIFIKLMAKVTVEDHGVEPGISCPLLIFFTLDWNSPADPMLTPMGSNADAHADTWRSHADAHGISMCLVAL